MPIFSLKHGGSEARLISYVGWQVFGLLTGSIGSIAAVQEPLIERQLRPICRRPDAGFLTIHSQHRKGAKPPDSQPAFRSLHSPIRIALARASTAPVRSAGATPLRRFRRVGVASGAKVGGTFGILSQVPGGKVSRTASAASSSDSKMCAATPRLASVSPSLARMKALVVKRVTPRK